jgi:antitoxin component of MazEF toxin-antitoxin module
VKSIYCARFPASSSKIRQSGSGLASNVITCYNCHVKLALRRIGNSLGVLVPKEALRNWGVGEGDHLNLSERGIRPMPKSGSSHAVLDELKRKLAAEVVSRFTPKLIRAQGLANLSRWRKSGVWGQTYAQWQEILESASDGELFAVMLGRDENSNRLRQSPPYVGLLPREVVTRLNEEASD